MQAEPSQQQHQALAPIHPIALATNPCVIAGTLPADWGTAFYNMSFLSIGNNLIQSTLPAGMPPQLFAATHVQVETTLESACCQALAVKPGAAQHGLPSHGLRLATRYIWAP